MSRLFYYFVFKSCSMKSLFDKPAYEEILTRMTKLTDEHQAQWGKMNVSQMLAHCCQPFKVALSEKKLPRAFIGILFGWMVKGKLSDNTPYKQGLPTAPNFVIKDEREFFPEKTKLIDLINEFHTKGPDRVGLFPHPFFGRMSKEAWGKSMYKHLDHHLRQFGA